jgi:hypothetical protein
MVVHLQPIGMVTQVMEHRLLNAAPDVAQVRESVARINRFSRAAMQSCTDVVNWIAPDPSATVALADGVAECVSLMRSSLGFRGFSLVDDLPHGPVVVGCSALRGVLPATLMALTDEAPPPAEVRITSAGHAGGTVLTLALQRGAGSPGFPTEERYRLLGWDEVEALAAADGVAVRRTGDVVTLTLPPLLAAP